MRISNSDSHRRVLPSVNRSKILPSTFASHNNLSVPWSCNFSIGAYFALCLTVILTIWNLVVLRTSRVCTQHEPEHNSSRLLSALKSHDALYSVVKEKVVYDKYARVYSRDVRFPDGQVFSFDIWGRAWRNDSFTVVAIVPFERRTRTLTLIREYNPAHKRHVYSFPQGVMEPSRHRDVEDAAAAELEEEAHLRCKKMIRLFSGKVGMPQDKYQRESVYSFLCADAVVVENPALVDAEEQIEIVRGVSISEFKSLAEHGALQSNNVATGLLALDRLQRMGFISDS